LFLYIEESGNTQDIFSNRNSYGVVNCNKYSEMPLVKKC